MYRRHRCHTLLLLEVDMVLMMRQSFVTHLLRGVRITVSHHTFNNLMQGTCGLDFKKYSIFVSNNLQQGIKLTNVEEKQQLTGTKSVMTSNTPGKKHLSGYKNQTVPAHSPVYSSLIPSVPSYTRIVCTGTPCMWLGSNVLRSAH